MSNIPHMIHSDKKSGQALVEIALILLLLLIILLGITEFARAWFVKNSYKNAVRSGVRVAVVTPVADFPEFNSSLSCPNGNMIVDRVCTSPGVNNEASVTIAFIDNDGNSTLSKGDMVTVTAGFNAPNFFIVGGSPWPWPPNLIFDVAAHMRYE